MSSNLNETKFCYDCFPEQSVSYNFCKVASASCHPETRVPIVNLANSNWKIDFRLPPFIVRNNFGAFEAGLACVVGGEQGELKEKFLRIMTGVPEFDRSKNTWRADLSSLKGQMDTAPYVISFRTRPDAKGSTKFVACPKHKTVLCMNFYFLALCPGKPLSTKTPCVDLVTAPLVFERYLPHKGSGLRRSRSNSMHLTSSQNSN